MQLGFPVTDLASFVLGQPLEITLRDKTKKGKQFVRQPKKIARKTRRYRT